MDEITEAMLQFKRDIVTLWQAHNRMERKLNELIKLVNKLKKEKRHEN